MAQINLDTSALARINDSNLDSQKERKAILDYLYQLTEQLRYWQNNIEAENLTEEFRTEYEGIRKTIKDEKGNLSQLIQNAESLKARVENAEGDITSLMLEADSIAAQVENAVGDIAGLQIEADMISQRVENAEGDATSAVFTAEQAMIKADNAEGEVAYLSLEVEEIRGMVGTQDGQTTFVQYEEPEGAEEGDIWMRTGAARWMTLRASTWAEIGGKAWGAYFNAIPATYIWDGVKWQLVADQAVVQDQNTQISLTKEAITQLANKTEVVQGQVTRHETEIKQTAEEIARKAEKTELNAMVNRVSAAEEKITPEAITNTVRTSAQYQNDLGSKVSQTVFDQTNESFEMRVQTVEEKSGKAETVTNTAMTLDKTGFHLKTGGTFTVDSGNFGVDENGNVSMKSASVSGNLSQNGIDVLTAKNLVVSSTQPTSPVPGMVWVKPVGSTAATFLYNNTSVQSFKNFETAHTLTNAGSAVAASGTYTYNVKIPYKVTGNVSATRYLTMYVNGAAIFTDVALEKTAGTYVLELGGNLSQWLGNANSLSFTLNLHYLSGDDGTLHNVHRVDVGAIDLKLYAKSNAASGWSGTEVQVYNG